MAQVQPALAAIALLALVSACAGDDATAPGPTATLDVVSGNTQTGPINTELPQPLVVRVTDASGHPVQGQIVNFRVTSGGGSMFAGAGSTNAQGIVQDRWTLGPDVGQQTAEARAVDNKTGAPIVFATFTATATGAGGGSGAPRFTVVGGNGQVAEVGTHIPEPVVFLAKDQNAAPVPGFTFTLRSLTCYSVDYSCSSYPGDDQLTNPTLITGTDGTATFTGWTLGTTTNIKCLGIYPGVSQPKFVDDDGLNEVCAVAEPGPPAQVVKRSPDNQLGLAGTTLLNMGVTVKDRYGNAVGCWWQTTACFDPNAPEVQVTFTPSAGGQASPSQATTERGVAYTNWTITSGTNTLTITVGTLSTTYAATGN